MNKVFTAAIFFVLFFSSSAFSQSKNLEYGFGGGLTYVLGPSAYTSDIDTTGNLGLKSGYHLQGKIKLGLQPIPVKLTGRLAYTSISGSKNNVIVNPTTAIDLESSTSIFTFALGAEYLINTESMFSPYADLELQMNAQGKTNFSRVFPNTTREISTDSRSRWGLGLGAGIDVGIMSQLNLDAGIRFNFVNMFGKMSNEDGFNTFTLSVNLLYHAR